MSKIQKGKNQFFQGIENKVWTKNFAKDYLK